MTEEHNKSQNNPLALLLFHAWLPLAVLPSSVGFIHIDYFDFALEGLL